MKPVGVYTGRFARELQRCEEEGRAAAARGENIETCPYRQSDKVAFWQRGHLLYGRQEFRQPAGTVAVKRDIPQLAAILAQLNYQPDSGEPGWWRYQRGNVAHWFAKPNQRSLCGGEFHDYAWIRDDSTAWCIACWRDMEIRRKWESLPKSSPAQLAERQAQLKQLMRD